MKEQGSNDERNDVSNYYRSRFMFNKGKMLVEAGVILASYELSQQVDNKSLIFGVFFVAGLAALSEFVVDVHRKGLYIFRAQKAGLQTKGRFFPRLKKL